MENLDFGGFLMTLRIGHGYSQFQLGKLMDVSDKAVSKWETGKAAPRLETCKRLAEIFGISIEDLLGMKSPEEERSDAARRKALGQIAQPPL